MTAEVKELQNALDRVGRGDATPAEATETIRSALLSDAGLGDRVYEALRDVTWRTLTARSFGEELPQWFEVFRHAAALARSGSADLAERIRGFAELLSQSARFAELQPVDELLTRKHSKAVLKAIAEAGKFIKRSALLNLIGLGEANLSRVTGALVAQGLVTRSSSGKEAHFALTQLGRQAAEQLDLLIQNAGNTVDWWHNCPFALAIWSSEGKPVAANAVFQQLTGTGPELRSFSDWNLALSKSARAERRLTSSTWQVGVEENKWLQFVEQRSPEGLLVLLGQDGSAQMEAVLELESRVEIAAKAEATLRRQLAESEERLRAYRIANVQLREQMANAAARSNNRLRHSILLLESPEASSGVPEELHQLETDLDGMQLAIRHLLDPADIVEPEEARVEWLDPVQIVNETVQAFSALNQKVEVTAEFGRTAKVRAPSSSVRTVLGQMLIGAAETGQSNHYTLYTRVVGTKLIAKVTPKGKTDKGKTDKGIAIVDGLGYGRVVAECHGGKLILGGIGAAEFCTMSFPVETEAL
jgi:PAS domain-containing protein